MSSGTQQNHLVQGGQLLHQANHVLEKAVLAAADEHVSVSSSCAQPFLPRSDKKRIHQQQAMHRKSHSLSESRQVSLERPADLKADRIGAPDVKPSPAEDTAGTNEAVQGRAVQTLAGNAAPAQPVRMSRLAGSAAGHSHSCDRTAGGSPSHGSTSSNPFSFEGSSSDNEGNLGSAANRRKPAKEPTVAALKARCAAPDHILRL